jgi:ketosteroid isomerase-like protein
VQARDTATEKRLLADDFIFVDTEGGAHGKAELVAALVDQAVAYQSIASDSVIEHVYGNAAVVSERLHTKLRVNGKPLDERARQTTTLVQGNSGWQIVASQGTRFPR